MTNEPPLRAVPPLQRVPPWCRQILRLCNSCRSDTRGNPHTFSASSPPMTQYLPAVFGSPIRTADRYNFTVDCSFSYPSRKRAAPITAALVAVVSAVIVFMLKGMRMAFLTQYAATACFSTAKSIASTLCDVEGHSRNNAHAVLVNRAGPQTGPSCV